MGGPYMEQAAAHAGDAGNAGTSVENPVEAKEKGIPIHTG